MTAKKLNLNFVFKLVAVLLCLVLLVTHLSSKLYAKYTSRASGSDSARVAVWNVDASSNESGLVINCADASAVDQVMTDAYGLTVTNDSEVAVSYDLIVVFNQALADEITLTLDNNAIPDTTTDNKTFVFSNVGQLGVGSTSKDHTLTFSVTYNDIDEDYSYDFQVTADFEQID